MPGEAPFAVHWPRFAANLIRRALRWCDSDAAASMPTSIQICMYKMKPPYRDELRPFADEMPSHSSLATRLRDRWAIYEKSGAAPKLVERPLSTRSKRPKTTENFAAGVGRGLIKSARTVREVALVYGTPIYVWENGKVVAKDPNSYAG